MVCTAAHLTHGKKPPHHRWSSEAGKHVVGAGEVREVGQQYALASALAPHVHLATLGLCGRRVCRVTGGDLHHPAREAREETKQSAYEMRTRGDVCGLLWRVSHLSLPIMICTGLSWLLLLPMPSCPYVLAPHAYTNPSSVRARE